LMPLPGEGRGDIGPAKKKRQKSLFKTVRGVGAAKKKLRKMRELET